MLRSLVGSEMCIRDRCWVCLAAWAKDYFTAARPWTQKGDEVQLPLGDTAPVYGNEDAIVYGQTTGKNQTYRITYDGRRTSTGDAGLTSAGQRTLADKTSTHIIDGGTSGIIADLASATGASINDLRKAVALQRYAENRAAYGSRYVEYLRSLGVRSSDAPVSYTHLTLPTTPYV